MDSQKKDIDHFGNDEQYWENAWDKAGHKPSRSDQAVKPDDSDIMMGKKGLEDPTTALQVIDAIADIYSDNVSKQQKEEAKRLEEQQVASMQMEEAPIDDAMALQKNIFTGDDHNPAQEQAANEAEWGKRIHDRREDDRRASKPVIMGVTDIHPEFNPPLTTKARLLQAVEFFNDPNNMKSFTPQARTAVWRSISNFAKNLGVNNHPIITKYRIVYDLEPVPYDQKFYSVSVPLYQVGIKSVVKCKNPEACEDASHDHQYFMEGFVTTPVKDLQGEIVSDKVYPEVVKAMTTPPHNLGWLDHESPYANPEDNQKTPPAFKFEEAKVAVNPAGKKGVWARALLNKAHPDFKNIWTEVKNGFYNAFSMEFMPLHEAKQLIGKELTNVVNEIKYLSTSLVRAPANEGAFITKVYAKSFTGFGWNPSDGRQPPNGTPTFTQNKEKMKMSEKDLGRDTGTTAPERSNTAIGEWGDPTLEKGQAKLQSSKERMNALNRLKPRDMPFAPTQRRATGAVGKAVPNREPGQVTPLPDTSAPVKRRPSESTQRPEDYKALKKEEEEGFSYQPSQDAPDVESDQTKFEEEEEDDEECKYEEAYKAVYSSHQKRNKSTYDGALAWLASKYPNMPIKLAAKAAGEMTEVLGEVNAPQKIDKEQVPPEVNYGKYGSPSVVPPLATFSPKEVEGLVMKTVDAALNRRGVRAVAEKRGIGPEQTVRDKSVADAMQQDSPDDIEGQLQVAIRRMAL